MPRETIERYPGQTDISAQFSAANLRKTLALYKKIMKTNGDYEFGELTTLFYQLDQSESQTWKEDLRTYPKAVQDEIKRHIIHALTHKDEHGHERPVPLTIEWTTTGERAVVVTYDPSAPSYKMEIFGLPAPDKTPFGDRRGKKPY